MNYDVRNSKKIGFVALLIATILLASCPEPVPPIELPDAPLNLRATAGTDTVTLTWPAVTTLSGSSAIRVSAVAGYRVYRDGALLTTGDPITDITYTDMGLTNDMEYRYTVRSVDSAGLESDDSIAVTARPGALPSAPAAPSITIESHRDVTLSWPAVTGATSYNIYRAEGVGPATMFIATVVIPTNPVTYTDTTVLSGTAYTYTVRALDNNLRESIGNPDVNVELFNPPANLTASITDEGVMLSWDEVTADAVYHIYRNRRRLDTSPSPIMGLTYTDTTVVNDTRYVYTVRARSTSKLESNNSDEAIVEPTFPPPANFTVVEGNGKVTLSWDAVIRAAGYVIYRSEGVGTESVRIATVSATTHTDEPVVNDTEYSYTVRAVGSTGTEGVDAALRATPYDPDTPLPAPNVIVTNEGGAVMLTWNRVIGAASYNIYRNRGALGVAEFMLINTVPASADDTLTYPDMIEAFLPPYTYMVRAVRPDDTEGAAGVATVSP